jgi:probable rRNA maturation factor
MDFPMPPEAESEESLIQFHIEDVVFPFEEEQSVAEWLLGVADAEGKMLTELNYIFCSDEYLLQVNREYLDHDYYTDVITFQLTEGIVHGDVFVSTERVRDNAATLGVAFGQELRRVLVHGLLHLAGYGDKSPEQEAVMRQKEDFYLQLFK